MSFPDKERIYKVLDRIDKGNMKPTSLIGSDASPIDKMKFNICQKVIKFKRVRDYSNKELAEIIDVGPAVISRVLHCQIDRFKVDALLGYYFSLVVSTKDKKLMKSFEKELTEFLSAA